MATGNGDFCADCPARMDAYRRTMMYEAFLTRIATYGIIPVLTLEEARSAGELAGALIDGGLPVAEVTFRSSEALAAIRTMSKREDFLVGAGTVRTLDQARAARDSGASYLVSPGFNGAVVDWAIEQRIPILPGVDSTLGIELAVAKGLNTLKFFPAVASGGPAKLNALHGPYDEVRFVPTGGINADNLAQWLAHPAVIACGGTWLAGAELLKNRKWREVERLVKEALAIVRQHAGLHRIPGAVNRLGG